MATRLRLAIAAVSGLIGGIWKWIAGHPPGRYFLFYFLLIPLFAGIYSCRPNDYYHSSVQHEDVFGSSQQSLEERLHSAIVENLKDADGELPLSIEVASFYRVSTSEWKVHDLAVDGNLLSFVINMKTPGYGRGPGSLLGIKVTFPLGKDYDFHDFGENRQSDGEQFIWRPIAITDASPTPFLLVSDRMKDWNFGALFPSKAHRPFPALAIRLPASLGTELDAFAAGANGLPYAIGGWWDRFCRMLYFSGITIATVGYGDIVPITTLGRMLALAESVLGVILIGLAINALADRRGS